jgi:hypothetical protein
MVCEWCTGPIPEGARCDSIYCSRRCRQTAYRLRARGAGIVEHPSRAALVRGRFAYADPPYPKLARQYYGREESFGGEVDHAQLVARLTAGAYVGWALSTSARALRDVLPLCPAGARVLPWCKPVNVSRHSMGLHNAWEPLIVVGGRHAPPGRRDWLLAAPARYGGTLTGRKPLAFCAFLFGALGMLPGDDLDDLYPGTGIVSRAWKSICFDSVIPRRRESLACNSETEGAAPSSPSASPTKSARSSKRASRTASGFSPPMPGRATSAHG